MNMRPDVTKSIDLNTVRGLSDRPDRGRRMPFPPGCLDLERFSNHGVVAGAFISVHDLPFPFDAKSMKMLASSHFAGLLRSKGEVSKFLQ